MEDQGAAILDALKSGTHTAEKEGKGVPDLNSTNKCYTMLEKSYDEEFGGFGKAPKFPQPGNLIKSNLFHTCMICFHPY